ncbi:MAG: SDR family oxidoreductase [Hyphomicrobiales bacterium]|nr:SDR family oxidoreductase [Hyphomicrobiales bacterium]MBV8662465.1 SDR family oxidoreductase [Hyphomicrobiales bacterium]
MERTYVVTGAASGIGAATVRRLRAGGDRVIACDLHHADVIADLTSAEGRAALIDGVTRLSGGAIDAILANAGGGPPETLLSLNFFGAVVTLEGLRPLLAASAAPRAVAVSSIAALRPACAPIVEACLSMDEPGAIAAARSLVARLPDAAQAPLELYGAAKYALQRWCRSVARQPQWAGAGIALNVVALGVFDTPAAATILSVPANRAAMGALVPMRGAFPGRPEEAAAILDWCVSPENSQMTGQILYADGGFECRARGDRMP